MYLIADNLRAPGETLEVLLHEVVGHYGIRGLMGKDFDPILRDIYEIYGRKGLEEIANRYGLDLNDPEDRKIAAEEKLAEMAQTGERPGFIRRVIAMIKEWLRKMGLDPKWTDADIKALLNRARGWVERGKAKTTVFDGERYSVVKDMPDTISIDGIDRPARNSDGQSIAQTEEGIRNFWRWFGDSGAVDEQGRPLVVYHSSGEEFNVFRKRYERDGVASAEEASSINRFGKGIFFSSDSSISSKFGGTTRSFYLKIDNLYEVNLGGASYFDGTLHDPETGETILDDDDKPMKVDNDFLPDEMAETHLDDKGKYNTGIVVRGVYENIPSKRKPVPMSDTWIVGNPDQIKSATGNNGQFDGKNPDIRFSLSNDEPAPKPKITPELAKRYNEFLDRAEEAVKNRNEEAALKWLAKADEMEQSWTPEPAAITLPVKPQEEMKTTGIKNAVTEEERETKGKNPVEVETRRSFGEAFDRGKEAVDSGQIDPRVLAENLAKAPRALSAEESVALIYDRMRLQDDHATVMEQIEKATADEDPATILEGRQRLAKIEDDINTNDEAARRTGYEQGLGLAARKMMIAEDYSLARSVQRMRVATGLPEIPEELRAKIETLTKQLQESLKKSETYEERIKELEAARKVRRMTEELAPVRRAEKRGSSSRKAMDTEFHALSNKLKAKFGVLNIGFDPEDIVVLAEMARNRVIAGITDAKAIVDDIYEDLKELPDLEKRDIRDAISGYGKSYKMTQDEINVDLREARRQMRLISALEDAQAGEPPLHSGLQRDPISDEVRSLQRQIKEAMRESGLDAQSMRSPEEQWKTAIDSVKTRLKNEIHDLDQQIAAGKRTHKEKSSIDYDEEAKKLKAIRDGKKRLLDEIDARPPKSEDELQKIHLKAYKTRTANRIHDLERKLKTGDFEKKARRALQMDPEALRLKAEAEKIKEAIDTEIRKQELANRTATERGLDWMVKWRRAVILSGSATIGKLTTAASLRQITTPLEELVGGVLSRMPIFSRISDKAPREGGGLNVRAEAEAMRQWFAKTTYMDAWDVIKTGRGELDRMYGKKHDLPPEAIEFFGHVHGALKIMPKRAEFYRSLQKRTEWAIKNGLDVSNPTTQATLFAESYVDANRAIFMQDNAIVTAYRMLINFLRHKGTGGRAGATALQMLMPIVKIPTNFVAETTSYAAGGAKAIGKLIGAKGIGNLTPEEADYVMRALKKQGIGLAMLVMGYLLASEIGGYYERGEKRKAGDVKAGGLRILGVDMPKWALHTPIIEVLQIGATLRRVENHYAEYNEKHPDKPQKEHAFAAGLFAGAKGLIEEVPFFEQPVRTGESLKTAESAGKFFGQFGESLIIPPDLRKISKSMDKAGDEQIPREQENFLQILQGSIPGQRKKLPLNMKKVARMQIHQLANIMENAPSYVADELKPAFRKKFRNSKGLEPGERQRYIEILRSE